jgi:ribosomal-protein-alanine N-acetyltransferase
MITSPAPEPALAVLDEDSGDLDAVMTIMTTAFDPAFGEAWTRSQCAGILPMSGVSLIVARSEDRGEPLGFALSRTIAGEAELLLLAVAPEHRRQRVGRYLLDRFIDRARASGVRRLHLEVRDGNPAVLMYRDAGFEPAGRRRRYYRGRDGREFDALTFARAI